MQSKPNIEGFETYEDTTRFAAGNGVSIDADERITPAEDFELKRLRKISWQMSNLRKQSREFYANKTMSPELKRQRLDDLQTRIVRLARQSGVGR